MPWSERAPFSRPVEPDIAEMIEVLFRRRLPRRLHHIELFLDAEMKDAVCTRFAIGNELDPADPMFETRRDILLHAFLGYDMFRVGLVQKSVFPTVTITASDTTAMAGQGKAGRDWPEEHAGPIQSWGDFERYPWPRVEDLDLTPLEYLEHNLPPNMGCFEVTAHVFEILSLLLGLETLCYFVFDEPALIDAILEKIGGFYVQLTRTLADFSCVAVLWGADDLGFGSGTMLSPEFLRRKILPWHRRCAQVAHGSGKPYLLHSCGRIDAVMDELIDDVGIDGKHSFEDAILPVTEAKRRYGHRVALLGGIDTDFLCRANDAAVRQRVRDTLTVCAPGGGYCLGTGSSATNYMPLGNFIAMIDEGRRFFG